MCSFDEAGKVLEAALKNNGVILKDLARTAIEARVCIRYAPDPSQAQDGAIRGYSPDL
jgi:hypothetical protein